MTSAAFGCVQRRVPAALAPRHCLSERLLDVDGQVGSSGQATSGRAGVTATPYRVPAMVFELRNCPSCGRGVLSTIGQSGRRYVIDVDPIEDGTVIVVSPSGASREPIAGNQRERHALHSCTGRRAISSAWGATDPT